MEGPKTVTIMDVGPRDGFQNITKLIPTDEKIKIVNMLSEAGVPKIETTSFVHPKWIPQLADSAEVFRSIQKKTGTVYSVLVPNEKGLDRAISSGVEDVAFVICASDALNMENLNKSIDATLAELPSASIRLWTHPRKNPTRTRRSCRAPTISGSVFRKGRRGCRGSILSISRH